MEDETQVEDNALEVQEENTEEAEESEVEEVDLQAELAKARELANNYKARAEKAEKKAKSVKETASTESPTLSTKDILALSKANIDDDDLDEVMEYASFKKLPIHQALQSSILKATLAEKAEQRKSAQVVNTGPGRRANTGTSDERLIADAQSGNMPDSEADIARLARLRIQKKV